MTWSGIPRIHSWEDIENLIPQHLSASVAILRSYVLDPNKKGPLIAVGAPGCGRGHWIDRTLESTGFVPRWTETQDPVEPENLLGEQIFQVIDTPKPKGVDWRCILLLDSVEDVPDELKGATIIGFPIPPVSALHDFCRQLGVPPEIVRGNPCYASVVMAARVYMTTGKIVQTQSPHEKSWEAFKGGGDPPLEIPLMAFYLADTLPPADWTWNRDLWLQTRVAATVGRRLWDAIRLRWPGGRPRFPPMLRIKRPAKADVTSPRKTGQLAHVRPPKRYSVGDDWD